MPSRIKVSGLNPFVYRVFNNGMRVSALRPDKRLTRICIFVLYYIYNILFMQQNESKLQANIVRWFALAYPKYERMFFAIENKRNVSPIQGAKLKQQGIKAGVADLCLALPTKEFGALYIELKFGKNKQTEDQKEFERACKEFGNCYQLIYSFDEAIRIITSYINSYNDNKRKIFV